jgi:hypothetical protein
MMKQNVTTIMKAIALCYKPYLKPEEALIYCNLQRSQLAKRCEEFGIYKNGSEYYKREELDKMLAGEPTVLAEKAKKLSI